MTAGREIVFDTETTGLSPDKGHRIVSLAAVELVNYRITGAYLAFHLNPGRPCDPGAAAVHGLSDAYLSKQPRFIDILQSFKDFVGQTPLIIHNAPFDMAFLNNEFRLAKQAPPGNAATCTLSRAREIRGWKGKNKLDDLVNDFGIDNLRMATGKHGALVDCVLLAQVYQALRGVPVQPVVGSALERILKDHYNIGLGDESTGSTEGTVVPEGEGVDTVGSPSGTGGGRTGKDLRGDAEVHHENEAGRPEPAGPASRDRSRRSRAVNHG